MSEPLSKLALSKLALLNRGGLVLLAFCRENAVPLPKIDRWGTQQWSVSTCAYYRPSTINICVQACAPVGTAGRQWSWPGYTVDRTPYGVLQHELGHHVDVLRGTRRGPYFSDFSIALRGVAGEKPISNYCPNDAEWFAEMFRVFVTNPDLLRLVRPRTYRELRTCFDPVFSDTWRERLAGAPERTLKAAERKIEAVRE